MSLDFISDEEIGEGFDILHDVFLVEERSSYIIKLDKKDKKKKIVGAWRVLRTRTEGYNVRKVGEAELGKLRDIYERVPAKIRWNSPEG
tara:strand:+ start:1701 stop:1967 length:267 start_codon:yes stop_codon:yes gene_type:complete